MFTREDLAKALYWEATKNEEVMRWDELSNEEKQYFYNMADFVFSIAPGLKKDH